MRFICLIVLFSLFINSQCHEHIHHDKLEASGQHSSSHLYDELSNIKSNQHSIHDHGHHGHAHHDHDHHGHSHHDHGNHNNKSGIIQTRAKTWLYALSSVIVISVLPCIFLLFIPAQNANGPLLKVLLAFGAGGLLGDAILHIIPHALHPHHSSHDHDHKHTDDIHEHNHGHEHDHSNELKVGVFVIAGIVTFMLVEQFVRIAKGGHCHEHGHVVLEEKRALNEKNDNKKETNDIRATAYLNLVADFVHNLTDGLAIGASFTAGNYIGMVTTLTVLLHELPHEVGDFAILVQSGFSKTEAIRVQLVTALGALSGCVISLIVSEPTEFASGAAKSWIMPFTAGGFIYIATVSVIPELLDHESSISSKSSKICQSLIHTIAISIGVGMMYCVSFLE